MSYRTQTQERSSRSLTLFIVVALLAAIFPALHPTTAVHAEGEPASYIILAKTTLPDDLAQKISDAGGTLTSAMSEIGVAVAESADPNFAANAGKIQGIQSVTPDVSVQWVSGQDFAWTGQDFAWTGQDFTWTGQDFTWTGQDFTYTGQAQNPPNAVDDDLFFNFQWNLDAINAPEAWELGAKGKGVRVAVLDAGFELEHPDFYRLDGVNNIDAGAGDSFVPNEPLQFDNSLTTVNIWQQVVPLDSHATHVAGIIAAADNGMGVIGVAPEATIVPVKVLSDETLRGDFESIIDGIMHAAELQGDQAVQIINMSLGAAIPRDGYCDPSGICLEANEIAALVNSLKRATDFAAKQGITIVAAAGNIDRFYPNPDMDHQGNLYYLPADLPGVLAISATGPNGWGLDPNTNLDLPADYSRYGQSYVDFAAPGGNIGDIFGNPALLGPCNTIPVVACFFADLVYSTSTLAPNATGWNWLLGTSMAAPHAAGVAALIIGQNGGSMKPAHVEAKLRQSADDLGKPGNDAFYGQGRINALRAVQE